MPHLLVAGKIHAAGIAVLEAARTVDPSITFTLVPEAANDAYVPHMESCDGLVIRTQPLTAEIIAKAKALSVVSRHGVGYDAVDVAALNSRNIPLCIVGDVNSRAVAEHTLMLMLAVARRAVAHDQATRSGNWTVRNAFETLELDGKRLLLVGFGRIGRRVAQLAQAFGMIVAAHDPFVTAEIMAALQVENVADYRAALPAADYVSLHAPPASGAALIGPAEMAGMKRSAIIINAARGGLVDEAALDAALRAGQLGGAGLDVLVNEPPRTATPLLSNPLVTLSPHSAGLTDECAARMAVSSVQNVLDHFAGRLDRKLVVNAAAIGL